MSRKRKQQQQRRQQPTPNQQAANVSSVPKKERIWRRLSDKHQQFSNWATLGGFLFTLALALWNSVQISEKDKQLKLVERQMDLLKESLDKQNQLEITPRLTAEVTWNRIKLTDYLPQKEKNPLVPIVRADGLKRQALVPDTADFVRVRNIGRGPANHAIVLVFIDRILTKDKEYPRHDFDANKETAPLYLKTVAAGDSVWLDHFRHPIELLPESQCIVGNFGLFCFDEEGYEITALQEFRYTLHFEDDEPPYATMDILSPRLVRRMKGFHPTKSIQEEAEKYFSGILTVDRNNRSVSK